MPLKLPKDSFLALAAIGWADGNLDPKEGEAFIRAAKDAGLPAEEVAEIESYTKKKITIPEVETIRMTRTDRAITYALATWIVRIDGVVTNEEKDVLKLMGDRLGIPDGIRSRASAAAFEIFEAKDRPKDFDFDALEKRLMAKIGDVESE